MTKEIKKAILANRIKVIENRPNVEKKRALLAKLNRQLERNF